ncbi:hypothetical protein RhiirB3_452919 [Rhizophagus irregularis]|nr:hypothetical protein RhiirB3_452919 [Rhizophagus irregularis]
MSNSACHSWSCIIADLDFAQAKGLGLALNKIDSTKDWKEHLIHILNNYLLYFYYNKIQEKRYGEAVVDEMNAFLIAKLDFILPAKVGDWILDNEIWINTPNSTNAAEAAHALSNHRERISTSFNSSL